MMEVMLYRWYSNAKLFGRRFIHEPTFLFS